MDLDIRIELGPWDLVRGQLEQGLIDMLPGMYKTLERGLTVDFTIPHFISSYGIFAKPGSGIRGIEDLADKRVAVQNGDVGHDYLLTHKLAGDLVLYNTWEDIFAAVNNGEADCALASMVQGTQLLQEKRYAELQQIGAPLIQQQYCMAVTKGDAALLAALNEGLNILKSTGEYDKIYEKWFGVYEESYIRSQRIYQILMAALGAALLVGVGALVWSALLRRQVHTKTLVLSQELALKEESQLRLSQALKEAERLREDADRSRLEAEEANKTKSVFLAGISHELRTPLHGIIGISHLLQRSALDEDQKRLLEMQLGAASQLERLISDLLDLTRSATGTLSLNPVEFRLGELLEWMEAPLRRQAEARGLNLRFMIGEPELRLMADKERLAQIVVNLASNGIKFTETGEVAVSIGRKGAQLTLEVSDTGPGIPAAEQDHIFETFYQLDKSPSGMRNSGLGLGLSIVRLLVRLMDGTITLRNRKNGGSTFSILLPLTEVPQDTKTEKNQPPYIAGAHRHRGEARQGRSVLIVEDEAINRMYIQRILREQGMATTEAGDGKSAVSMALGSEFDLILMDMGLPVMNGLEATRNIRKAEIAMGRRRTPIAALTANAFPQDREECINAGMDDFISKPFEEKNLWLVVDRLLDPKSNPSVSSPLSPSADRD